LTSEAVRKESMSMEDNFSNILIGVEEMGEQSAEETDTEINKWNHLDLVWNS
jgi:hypothetical protein